MDACGSSGPGGCNAFDHGDTAVLRETRDTRTAVLSYLRRVLNITRSNPAADSHDYRIILNIDFYDISVNSMQLQAILGGTNLYA